MTTFRPDPLAYLTGRLSSEARPPSITEPGGGGKFTPEGAVLPFPGNTIVCHVDPESGAHAALARMQAALRAGPHADAFTFLPPSSFHMTVFQGVSGRLGSGAWPEGIAPHAPLAEATDVLHRRVAGVEVPAAARIRPVGLFGGYSLTVEGADEAEEAALRRARAALREASGLRPRDFDTYTFHVTLAYALRWLTGDEARAVLELADTIHREFVAEVPVIELGPPELCTFENMHRFDRHAWIGTPMGAEPASIVGARRPDRFA